MGRDTTQTTRLQALRGQWRHRGARRPPFADEPAEGQESVWDYPRPPVIVPDTRLIEVRCEGILVARTRHALRVLETASPPTFYLPRGDVDTDLLEVTPAHSFCEWKGRASYFDLRLPGRRVAGVAWSYESPLEEAVAISGRLAFYPGRVACFVDGERVRAQSGDFYGGWITDEIIGPFKGEPGTEQW